MYFPMYLAYKFSFLLNPFFLIGKRKLADDIYQITDDIKLKLRKYSTDSFIVWEVFNQKGYVLKGFEIKPHDNVVDIGSHIGIFATYAANKARNGLVLAYEPVPENYQLLQRNKILNRLSNLKIFNVAVSATGQDITLHISSANTGGHSIYPVDSKQTISVPSITLEDIILKNRLNKIDYLKLDIEGGEFEVILNTPKQIFEKIDKIVMEYHDYLSPKYQHNDIVKYLEDCGFNVTIKGSLITRKIFRYGTICAKRE